MKTVALISQKGGSAKTTNALSLVVSAFLDQKSTILFDTDPQISATKWYDRRQANGQADPYVKSIQSARLESELEWARDAGADLAVIDTPPHGMGDAQNRAYAVSDLVVIPTHASMLDLDALEQTHQLLNRSDKPAFILISALRKQSTSRFHETRRFLENKYSLPVLDFFIPELYSFQDSHLLGQTPREYEPESYAAHCERRLYIWLSQQLWPDT